MSVRKAITETNGIYFVTITNFAWLHLFSISDVYVAVFKCPSDRVSRAGFDYLKSKGHLIIGYVIMPNHLHCLIAFLDTEGKSINTIIGSGKRFMAYDLVDRLEKKSEQELLAQLACGVNPTDRKRGKFHEVFEPSFDCKPCLSVAFIEQTINYIHANPCRGKWNLVQNPSDYEHSSAKFYLHGIHSCYRVTSYGEIADMDLTKNE